MPPRKLPLLLLLCFLAGCNAASPAPLPTLQAPSIEEVRKNVEYLASDPLEGRGIGTAGLDEAATYIAGYFRELGLQPPPGHSTYDQPFTHTIMTGLAEATALRLGNAAFAPGRDFNPLGISAEGRFAGPVVFVGYGISSAASANGDTYDDFAGVDLQDKVALALRFEPHDQRGQSRFTPGQWSEHATLSRKARAAAERGATALLVVHPPRHHGEEILSPLSLRAGQPLPIPVLQVKAAVAARLLRQARAPDLATLQDAIDNTFSPRSFILKQTAIEGEVALKRSTFNLRNITAYLPGQGRRADEVIVIGAHYDHLGRGGLGSRARGSREIHNGADDNASGVAAVLELARILSRSGPLDRSILFCAFTAEEVGLVGSKHWVDNPPVPLERIVAMVNLDMVGRLRDKTLIIGGSSTAGTFGPMLDRARQSSPLTISEKWKDGFAPSDSTSFSMKRIPALFFFTGVHADYHRPTDDADRINYDGMGQVIDLAGQLIMQMTRMTRKDLKYIAPSTMPTTGPARSPTGGASLGVIPEYGEEQVPGVRISGAMPDSPASKAGLQPGDIITKLGDKPIRNLYDLTDALGSAKPGQQVPIEFQRGGAPMKTTATLTAPRERQ